jgi:uncharacterized membrane protein YhaH (DUF805 family)
MSNTNPYQAPRAKVADWLDESGQYQDVNLWSASGRIGRARYIAWTMGSVVIFYLVGVLAAVLIPLLAKGAGLLGLLVPLVMLGGGLALFIFQIRLTIQRCHDFDVSGWLTLIILIPLAAFAFWIAPGTDGANRWGPKTAANSAGVLAAAWLGALVIPLIGILAAIAIPSYQDYTNRARAAQRRMQQEQPQLPAPEQR